MVLADYQIDMELRTGRLKVSGPADAPFDPAQIQASSIDLRLGHFFRKLLTQDEIRGQKIAGVTEKLEIDPSNPGFSLTDLFKAYSKLEIPQGSAYQLHPGEAVIAQTLEEVELPIYLAGRVEGRSQPQDWA